MEKRMDSAAMVLPMFGIGLVLIIWTALSLKVAPDLPSPLRTWQESQNYILNPFFKDGEMNQGILRFAFLSLIRVAKGFLLGNRDRHAIGFFARPLAEFSPSFRSGDSSAATDFAVGLAAVRFGASSSSRNRRRCSPSRSAPCGRR